MERAETTNLAPISLLIGIWRHDMRDITPELNAIEQAARGEEVRDSIISALTAMTDGINYVACLPITVDEVTADSSVYTNGYVYTVTVDGILPTTLAIPSLLSLSSYQGRYAAKTDTDTISVYFEFQPVADLQMEIYYFVDNYEDIDEVLL
jgi:hypothetical protein